MKKMQKASAISLPERQSARLKSVAETAAAFMQPDPQPSSSTMQIATTPKTSSLGPRRTACDSCRKRKMRCKHVETTNGLPIVFTNPMESSPQSTFMGVVIPENGATPSHPPAAAFPPPFQVDPLTPMQNGLDLQGFNSGPKQEITDLKKGRTKACYDCRRSKVGHFHQ